ncbi:restriction endonuclease subunit S [Aliiroseovarius sp. M344]|uniref:restriction endonuclease subunit S n=1 Tax=Aliiroseovarius sp. M344 TaxID=2867010 RepID=UPI0021ADC8F9|nr:restriction endonuclease subunit S [Aliiroseovarius sp. M344]UWQ15664.1 restriction endonuclease subunit S [Aliiroseovarius sp. M344]
MKDTAVFGWPSRPLGDLVDVLDRMRKPITKKDRKAGQYPYYGATGVLDHVDGYIFDEPLVLIGEDGAKWEAGANSAFAIEGKTWVNNHAHVIRPHRDQVLDDWLIYYLNGADLMPFISGMTVPKLNQGRLREIPIPLPPLEEQKRIVAVLDEAFEGLTRARAHAEANLQNARELFESIKADELAYSGSDREEVILSEVADITSGLIDPREDAFADMLHLGAGNMITGTDELIDVKTAREEKLKSGKYLFDETTILYSKIRPYLRKVARPDFQGLCSADVYPLTPKPDRLDRDFLFHLLLGHDFTEYAISGSDRAGMPKVNRNHMFAYRFELPPVEAQRRIVKVIDEAHNSCSALVKLANKKLQDLDDLRQSLLQKAFAGELT